MKSTPITVTDKPIDTADIPEPEQNGSNFMAWSMAARINLWSTQAFPLLTTPPPAGDVYHKALVEQVAGFLPMTSTHPFVLAVSTFPLFTSGSRSKTSETALPSPQKPSIIPSMSFSPFNTNLPTTTPPRTSKNTLNSSLATPPTVGVTPYPSPRTTSPPFYFVGKT